MSGEMCGAGGEGWVGTVGHLHLSYPQAPLRWEGRREEFGIVHLKKKLFKMILLLYKKSFSFSGFSLSLSSHHHPHLHQYPGEAGALKTIDHSLLTNRRHWKVSHDPNRE